jgi:hypothetical protein
VPSPSGRHDIACPASAHGVDVSLCYRCHHGCQHVDPVPSGCRPPGVDDRRGVSAPNDDRIVTSVCAKTAGGASVK